MSQQLSILEQLVGVLRQAWDEGSPVAGWSDEAREKRALVALRRIQGFNRRGVSTGDRRIQVADVAKGLIAQFEREPQLVGRILTDYEHIAERILAAHSSATDRDV